MTTRAAKRLRDFISADEVIEGKIIIVNQTIVIATV